MTPTITPPTPHVPAPPANGPAAPSPVEYVRGLPPEDKQAVFLTLLREALEYRGDAGLLPVEDEDGKPFGYYVPPNAAKALSDQQWAEMPAEVRERFSRPVRDLDNCISSDEMLAILSRGAGSPAP